MLSLAIDSKNWAYRYLYFYMYSGEFEIVNIKLVKQMACQNLWKSPNFTPTNINHYEVLFSIGIIIPQSMDSNIDI